MTISYKVRMKIENLDIKGFGKLNNISFNFKEGLNIIYGPNESGKSSIEMFIKSMLYGIKGGRQGKDGTPSMQKKYKPWIGDSYGGSLQYSLDNGNTYKVERNFNNNSIKIYDSHFNDIIGSFEATKDKGVLFAEKHLGLNENCFSKTVFIKQLDMKVGSDGTGELQNKLINIAQSGFEDVSYSKAHAALTDALKNYVGTGKTTTRPLDVLSSKLADLKKKSDLLQSRRTSLLDTEKALNKALSDMDDLVAKKQFLQSKKVLMNKQAYLEQLNKNIYNASALLEDIRVKEAEQIKVFSELKKLSSQIDKNSAFSSFESEDSEDISIMYYRYTDMLENEKRLSDQIASAKASMELVTRKLDELKRISAFDKSVVDGVTKARRELDGLLEEQKIIHATGRDKVSAARTKPKASRAFAMAAICLAAAAAFAIAALTGILPYKHPLLALSAAGIMLACIPLYKQLVSTRANLVQRKSSQKAEDIYNNTLIDKIDSNKKIIGDFLTTAGYETLEDFFNAKYEFDSTKHEHVNLNYDINRLEHEHLNSSRRINELEHSLCQKLEAVGIISSYSSVEDNNNLKAKCSESYSFSHSADSDISGIDNSFSYNSIKHVEIKEDHIKAYNHALKEYRAIKPRYSYLEQRKLDLARDIEGLYRKVTADFGISCSCSAEFENKISSLKEEAINFKTKDPVDKAIANLHDIQSCNEASSKFFNNIYTPQQNNIDSEYEAVCEEINNLNLKIKDYQVALNESINDSDELQKLEEEICELQLKKERLETIGQSLNTALDVLDEASTEIQHNYSPLLNSSMNECIKNITNDKYIDLRADDNLLLNVVTPETGEVVNISYLSGGAIDQLYLSLRLSMAGIMSCNGEKIPLMLDEIFSQYDDERTKSTLEFLKEHFSQNQLLIFTCKEREVDIAARVFGESANIMRLG